MSYIQEEVGLLINLQNNLKKSINKKIKTETLKTKLEDANALYVQIEASLSEQEETIPDSEFKFLVKAARNAITDIRNIIKLKLEHPKGNPKAPKMTENAAPQFDYKTATAIVQPYDGSADGLDTFLDSANLIKDMIAAPLQATAVKFLRTRLTGKARLGLPDGLRTIDELLENVKTRCMGKSTPENIIAKMKATKQRDTLEKFCDEVENLTSKLQAVYLNNKIPDAISKSMATKAGIDALINGVNCTETKTILKAGTFNDISEAVQKINENAIRVSASFPNAQMLTFRGRGTNKQYSNSSRYNQNAQYANRGRNNFQPRQQFHTQSGNQFQYRGNFSYNRNNSYHRGRGGRYNANAQRRVYTTDAVQMQNVSPQVNQQMSNAAVQPNQFQHQAQQQLGHTSNANNFLGQAMLSMNQHQH